jgi:histone chaperone ASF1
LEWKLIYVASVADERLDQVLDSVLVGPVNIGSNTFVFEAPPPNPDLVPDGDLLEVTVLLLTCSYRDQQFIRIGTTFITITSLE